MEQISLQLVTMFVGCIVKKNNYFNLIFFIRLSPYCITYANS